MEKYSRCRAGTRSPVARPWRLVDGPAVAPRVPSEVQRGCSDRCLCGSANNNIMRCFPLCRSFDSRVFDAVRPWRTARRLRALVTCPATVGRSCNGSKLSGRPNCDAVLGLFAFRWLKRRRPAGAQRRWLGRSPAWAHLVRSDGK